LQHAAREEEQQRGEPHSEARTLMKEEQALPWALFLLVIPFVVGCASFVLLVVWDSMELHEDIARRRHAGWREDIESSPMRRSSSSASGDCD
jgi:hypothetical protein